MRRMLAMKLAEQGYEVLTANDGAEGLARVREKPHPELIITDFEMPEMDGAGLCRQIKQDREIPDIPVIVMTSLGEADKESAGLEAGADDYIQKPRSPEDFQGLFARIETHLRAPGR
jgi:sigma-B regulation protein RsbU (phosphoserine phosphatase)